MPCGCIFRRGLSPVNRVKVRTELVLKAVLWWMLYPTTKFVVVALAGLIACQVDGPEGGSGNRWMTKSCHAEGNVEENRQVDCVKVNGGRIRVFGKNRFNLAKRLKATQQ